MQETYQLLKEFKKKYPLTIAWRIKAHSKVIGIHLNPDEEVLYAFAGQKGEYFKDLFHTYVVVITTTRILVAQKRLIFGYFCTSVTPDLFNDLSVDSELIWGKVNIDTLNEKIVITNIDKKALPEIETVITTYMIEANKNRKGIKND